MKPFKDYIDRHYYETLAQSIGSRVQNFDQAGFVDEAMTGLDTLELKMRITRTRELCRKYVPGNFREQVDVLMDVQHGIDVPEKGLAGLFVPEFIACYGRNEFDYSMERLKEITAHSSSEFAVRPFIEADTERALEHLYTWVHDDNHHVRRLASEGSRPRLPWGLQLKQFIENPEPLRRILECLKTDTNDYVKRSVANNLNDISKDNSRWMLELVSAWDRENRHTAWIVKHAARSLLKQGEPAALPLFGFTPAPAYELRNVVVTPREISLGDEITFSFDILGQGDKKQKLLVDYVIHYLKKNGSHSEKVFKLKELTLDPGEAVAITKKQTIKDLSVRKHYPGTHYFQVQVNGERSNRTAFTLHS